MTFVIWMVAAIASAFFLGAGCAYLVGYRNGYKAAMRPVAGAGPIMGEFRGHSVAAGIPPDREDGNPMP